MATFMDLPCELIAMILRNLDGVRDLVSPILTCKHFYASFLAHPDILAQFLRAAIPENLLHYSIAAAEASSFPGSPSDDAVTEYLNVLFHCPDKLTEMARRMPLRLALKMEHTYGVINALVHDYARDTWSLFSGSNSEMEQDFELSDDEYFRFCRAFYRMEIYIGLFRDVRSNPSSSRGLHNREYQLYLSRYSPWEHEQLGSIYDFLEVEFLRASREVLFHDIELGKYTTDYLKSGSEWIQWGLSQGVGFVYKLMNETSYEKKLALIRSSLSTPRDNIRIAFDDYLMKAQDEMSDNDSLWLLDLTVDDIRSLTACADSEDADDGPLAAWRYGHRSWALGGWTMLAENSGLRERGYVFWDLQRIERWKLLSMYSSVPENKTSAFTKEEYQTIVDSLRERSEIWRNGGRGYWSKNDLSRIEWPQAV